MIRHGSIAVVAGVLRQASADSESPRASWPVSDTIRASASLSRRRVCERCGRVGVAGFWQDQHMGLVCRNLVACWQRLCGQW